MIQLMPYMPTYGKVKTSYWKLNETTGDAIDSGTNGIDGVLVGGVTRDGTYYSYADKDSYVQVPDNDVYSFDVDKGFVIKTNVIWDIVSSSWLVSKRFPTGNAGFSEWNFIYFNGALNYTIWDSLNTLHTVSYTFSRIFGQEYVAGVTLIDGTLKLFLDGVVVDSLVLPAGVVLKNTGADVTIGSVPWTANANVDGKQREVFIQNGLGWTDQEILDNSNNNGVIL